MTHAPSGLLRIDNRTLSQRVYEELKQKMITAELMPGARISLRGIAAQLGVSLMPVRQALWQLERDKVVVVEHNRQIRVNRLSADEFDEILELRLVLECKAAEEACRLRPDGAVDEVSSALERMAEVGADTTQFLQHNHDYHMLIYAYGNRPNLIDLIDNLWTRVGPYIYLATLTAEDMGRSMGFHRRMYDAFRAGDAAAMTDAVRRDLTAAADQIRPVLENPERRTTARAGDLQRDTGAV